MNQAAQVLSHKSGLTVHLLKSELWRRAFAKFLCNTMQAHLAKVFLESFLLYGIEILNAILHGRLLKILRSQI